jgi:hypothetical protein
MKTRHCLVALAAIAVPQAAVHGLTAPSDSDGPVKLLTCVVTPQGTLEAEVDSQSDDAVDCSIRCNYEFGDKMLSQNFNVTVPAHFHGRVGRIDVSPAKAGNYSGDVGTCKKS